MANRYVRSTGGNWSSAGTWESASGLKDSVAVPTSSDDVYLDGQSGQLTIDTTTNCNSFNCVDGTGGVYTGILTLVGQSQHTIYGTVVKLSGSMTITGSTVASLYLAAGTTVTMTSNAVTWPSNLSLANTTVTLADNWTVNKLTGTTGATILNGNNLYVKGDLYLNANPISGTTNIIMNGELTKYPTWTATSSAAILSNNLTINFTDSTGGLTISGTVYYSIGTLTHSSGSVLTTSTSVLDLRGGCILSCGNFLVPNVTFTTAGTYNATFGCSGTVTISDSNTWTNLIIKGSPTVTITTAKTQTMNGAFDARCASFASSTGIATIITSASDINLYLCSFTNITAAGIGTFNSYGGTDGGGNTLINFNALPYTRPTIDYMDYANGNDAITSTPWGWWSVPFATGNGTVPAVDETVTGETSASTAKVTFVETLTGTWGGGNAAGNMYFYGKSAPFQAETVDGSASTFVIGADFTYCAWQTVNYGATTNRIKPGDTIKIAKTGAPVSIGTATWSGTGVEEAKGILSSTNTTPIQVVLKGPIATLDSTPTAGGTGYAVGDYLTITGGAAVAIVTSIGTNGTVTGVSLVTGGLSTYYVASGITTTSVPQTGTGCTLNIITITGHGYSTNDYVQIAAHSTNTNAVGLWKITKIDDYTVSLNGSVGNGVGTASGTCAKANGKVIILDSAQTLNVDTCDVAWTLQNGATGNLTKPATDAKEGLGCMLIAKTSPNSNTIYAYSTISSTNFSPYQKISFWIKNSTVITAGQWKICLCSDTAGATIQDTFLIPAIPSSGQWVCLTLTKNGGGNMYNGIQSIALYSDTTPGTISGIYLDNIIACTTSGLNLQSLISKNSAEQGGTEPWQGIQSINGTTIILDNIVNSKAQEGRGYYSATASENVTTYIRETFKTPMASASEIHIVDFLNGGSEGNNIQFQGGYNTSTNAQTGETIFDGLNGLGWGLLFSGFNNPLVRYITINYLNAVRYNYSVLVYQGSWITIDHITCACNSNAGINFLVSYNNTINTVGAACNNGGNGIIMSYNSTIGTLNTANSNLSSGIQFSQNSSATTIVNANNNSTGGVTTAGQGEIRIGTITNANYNVGPGVNISWSSNVIIDTVTNSNYNMGYGLYLATAFNNKINTINTTGNLIAGIGYTLGNNYIRNASIAETIKAFLIPSVSNIYTNSSACLTDYATDSNDNRIYTEGGSNSTGAICSQTAVRHTASGIAWKISPNNAIRCNAYPLKMIIARIACNANKAVTVKTWMYRDNAGIIGKLVCRGKQIAGVDSDVTSSLTLTSTWEEVTLANFTPTEAGVVEIEIWAYGGTSYNVYIDDMTITQAT